MELKAYLAILWRRKWVIMITAAVTLIVAVAGTLMLTPQYAASATLRVPLSAGVAGDPVRSSDLLYADRLMNTYQQIATSQPVLQELARRLGRQTPPEVDVALPANTELMRISVTDPDPVLAAKAANDMADILVSQGRELYTGGGKTAQEILGEQLAQMERDISQARSDYEKLAVEKPSDTQNLASAKRLLELREETYTRLLEQYEQTRANEAARQNTISLIEPAVVPDKHSSPDKSDNFVLALLAGLVAGVGLAFLFERLDPTLYTTKKIEEVTQLPVLGQIPANARHDAQASFTGSLPEEEAFHRLRIAIVALDRDSSLKTLLVTSAEPKVGKSTIVANLARAVAQTGRRVVVVDADMRRPTLHAIFGVPNQVGLSSVLGQAAGLDRAVQPSAMPGVQILTSGPLVSSPAELFGSSQMQDVLRQLAQQYDLVLLDAPALGMVADAGELALAADGVILVVRRAYSQEDAVRNACRQLATLKAKLIGVIDNHAGRIRAKESTRQRVSSKSGPQSAQIPAHAGGGAIYPAPLPGPTGLLAQAGRQDNRVSSAAEAS